MSVERLGGAARANEDDENVDEDQINNENIEDDDEDDDDDDDAANRGRWSVAEDTQLRAAIATHGNSKTNWHAVSLLVPGRSALQCANRYRQAMDKSVSKGRWTAQDDAAVLAHVYQHGLRNWSSLGRKLGRLGKQCRERYFNCLDDTIDRSVWTDSEEMTLVEAQLRMGNRWAQIAQQLPGRTANAVKNHWHSAVRRRRMASLLPQIEAKLALERQNAAAAAAAAAAPVATTSSNTASTATTEHTLAVAATTITDNDTQVDATPVRAKRSAHSNRTQTNNDGNKRRRTTTGTTDTTPVAKPAVTPTAHVDQSLPPISEQDAAAEKTPGPTPPLLSAAVSVGPSVRTRSAVSSSLKDLVVFCEQALLGSDV